MKTVQVYRNDTEEAVCSLTEYPEGIRGIAADGYTVVVDDKKLYCQKEEGPVEAEHSEEFAEEAEKLFSNFSEKTNPQSLFQK